MKIGRSPRQRPPWLEYVGIRKCNCFAVGFLVSSFLTVPAQLTMCTRKAARGQRVSDVLLWGPIQQAQNTGTLGIRTQLFTKSESKSFCPQKQCSAEAFAKDFFDGHVFGSLGWRPLLLDWRPSLLALMAKRPLRCLFLLFQRSVPFTPGLNNFSLEVTWK